MKRAVAKMEGISPYSQSRYIPCEKKEKESAAAFEERCWRERMHVNGEGRVFIPPMAFKNCLAAAARFLGEKIPGKRNATWTKHFLSGVLVMEGLDLGLNPADVPGETLFVPSDGVRGGGKRVMKTFPRIDRWKGEVAFYILDETITEEAFGAHLREAGNFIGLGRFRPENGGFYGRFKVLSVKWSEE
jgi:hypothetical protein